MKMIPKLLFAVFTCLLLASVAGAFSPPSPFPVVAYVEMGDEPLRNHALTVTILDSDSGQVYDRHVFMTGGDGRVLFDMSDLRGCSTFERDGACYAGESRGYAGDDVEFWVVWHGQDYKVVRNIEDLRLKIGVDPKSQVVVIQDSAAPVKVIEKEVVKEVEKEVPGEDKTVTITVPGDKEVVEKVVEKTVTKTSIVCDDGTEVENPDDCKTGVNQGMLAGLIAALLLLAANILAEYKWGKGFAGLIRYYVKKGDNERAYKMLNTAVKKAKSKKYRK